MKAIKMMYQVVEDNAYQDGRSATNRKLNIIRCMVYYGESVKVVINFMLDDVKSEPITLEGGYKTPLGDKILIQHYLKDYIDTHFSVKVRMIKYEEIEGDKNEK